MSQENETTQQVEDTTIPSTFDKFNLKQPIMQALHFAGFKTPSPNLLNQQG